MLCPHSHSGVSCQKEAPSREMRGTGEQVHAKLQHRARNTTGAYTPQTPFFVSLSMAAQNTTLNFHGLKDYAHRP